MPRQKQEFSLEDILQSTEKIIPQPEVATDTTESERGQLGAARQLGGAGRGGGGGGGGGGGCQGKRERVGRGALRMEGPARLAPTLHR